MTTLEAQIESCRINAEQLKKQYPLLNSTWWEIKDADLSEMQALAKKHVAGMELNQSTNPHYDSRMRLQYRSDLSHFTLFVFSKPVKARVVYE